MSKSKIAVCWHTIFVGGLGFAPVGSASDAFTVCLVLMVTTPIIIVVVGLMIEARVTAAMARTNQKKM